MAFGEDTGNAMNPPSDWGVGVPMSTRSLRMRIARTPSGIPERQPAFVHDWGHIGITPNGALITLGDATDEALALLDRIGKRGALVLGASAGFVFSTNRLLGAAVGAGLGFLAGRYLASLIKATVAAQRVVDVVAPAKAG
jgi:hypothetical protein